MLELKLGEYRELYDEETQNFVKTKVGPTLCFEHSLLSMSEWEAKYKKPFLSGKDDKTPVELYDYFCMMIVSGEASDLQQHATEDDYVAIAKYVSEDTQTATWFREDPNQRTSKHEIMTTEVIYYYMFANQIDISCERWNINRLLTLLRVFSEKSKENDPKRKKMSTHDIMARNKALNDARRKAMQTKG